MDKLIFGCGYLGTRVARRWLAAGHRVFATTRSRQRVAELQPLGLELILGDVLRPAMLSVLPVVDTVLYCVGFDRQAGHSMREVYVEGLANVLAGLRNRSAPCQRFLYVSSTSVYGQTGGEWVDETCPCDPLTDGGRTCLDAENTLLHDALGERAVILRFAGIYGPGRLLNQAALLSGATITGDPEKWVNLIHVEDGANVVVAAEEHARPEEIYNVADDEPVRRRDFYVYLANLLNAPPPQFATAASPNVSGAPAFGPGQDATNRRIKNQKMKAMFNIPLQFPTFREGLRASFPSPS